MLRLDEALFVLGRALAVPVLGRALAVPALGRALLAFVLVGRELMVGRLETVGLVLFPVLGRPETPALAPLGLLF